MTACSKEKRSLFKTSPKLSYKLQYTLEIIEHKKWIAFVLIHPEDLRKHRTKSWRTNMAAIASKSIGRIYCMHDPVLFRSVVQKSPLRVVFSSTTDSSEKKPGLSDFKRFLCRSNFRHYSELQSLIVVFDTPL